MRWDGSCLMGTRNHAMTSEALLILFLPLANSFDEPAQLQILIYFDALLLSSELDVGVAVHQHSNILACKECQADVKHWTDLAALF